MKRFFAYSLNQGDWDLLTHSISMTNQCYHTLHLAYGITPMDCTIVLSLLDMCLLILRRSKTCKDLLAKRLEGKELELSGHGGSIGPSPAREITELQHVTDQSSCIRSVNSHFVIEGKTFFCNRLDSSGVPPAVLFETLMRLKDSIYILSALHEKVLAQKRRARPSRPPTTAKSTVLPI